MYQQLPIRKIKGGKIPLKKPYRLGIRLIKILRHLQKKYETLYMIDRSAVRSTREKKDYSINMASKSYQYEKSINI